MFEVFGSHCSITMILIICKYIDHIDDLQQSKWYVFWDQIKSHKIQKIYKLNTPMIDLRKHRINLENKNKQEIQ